MILTALANYYEQLLREHPDEVSERGWSRVKIGHLLVISEAGELVNIIPAQDTNGWMKRVPEQSGRSGKRPKPYLLADDSRFMLGIGAKGVTDQSRKYFGASKKAHLEAFSQVDSAAAHAVCAFFESWNPEKALESDCIRRIGMQSLSKDKLAFWHEEKDVAEDEAIVAAWEERYGGDAIKADVGVCLVTGKRAPIARLHPVINGVKGATNQPRLVSFHEHSFESYGHYKEQGLNAPVSKGAAFAYGEALNFLTKKENTLHHVCIDDITVVYWAERADDANSSLMSLLLGGSSKDLLPHLVDETNVLELDAIMKGLSRGCVPNARGIDPDATFHVIGLTGGKARITVRFYERDSFGSMLENVMRHYRRMAIVHAPWQQDFLSPYWIVHAAENPNAKNPVVSSELGGALLRSILTDTRYPESLYANIMLRLRATQDDEEKHTVKASYERAAFIKAYLIKNASIYEEGTMETVNAERDEMAYVLGRVFWVLEDTQHVANPGINATIADKYFDTACATPALVFPTLLTLSKKHLRKVKRDKPGLAHNLEAELEALLARIESFPKSLSNTAQGDFVLGYYHQKNADIQERTRKRQEREADEAAASAE